MCSVIRTLWESNRSIPEPSGAMGLAAIVQDQENGKLSAGEKVLTVICGANMDFAQLANIAQRAGIGSRQRRYIRVPIPEGKGTLVEFLKGLPKGISIVDVQYGKVDSEVQHPVLGLIGTAEEYLELDKLLEEIGVVGDDVSTEDMVGYRIINYSPELFESPLFINIEFPERAGAFLEFMEQVKDQASLCYFNYSYSGERVGRAMVGMEFQDQQKRDACLHLMESMKGKAIRAVKKVSDETFTRLRSIPNGRRWRDLMVFSRE